MSFIDFLGAVSFLLIALVVSESQGEVVPSRNSSTGLTGKFDYIYEVALDQINHCLY